VLQKVSDGLVDAPTERANLARCSLGAPVREPCVHGGQTEHGASGAQDHRKRERPGLRDLGEVHQVSPSLDSASMHQALGRAASSITVSTPLGLQLEAEVVGLCRFGKV
jgi:hypothetical protein